MDFNFSDDQNSLRDAVNRWVEKGFDFPRRHALAKAGGQTRAVYAELAGLGLTALAVPEARGGLGFGATEAMVVMEELGRGLVNAPFAAAALVVPALQERGARYRLSRVTTTATQGAAGWALTGQKITVPAADEADAFIVPARITGAADDEAGIGLFVVEKGASGSKTTGYPTQDGGRAGELMLNNTTATLISADGFATLAQAVDVGIAAVCAEGVGLMDKMLLITVDYMNTRKQFGSTLAGFQALRHRIADVKMHLELGRSMSYFASMKLGEAPAQRQRAISQAKVQLGQSMRYVGQQCTQIHGGIGVTDEYISSHYFKRLTMLEMAYGDTMHHLGEVSARMQDTAGVFA